MKILTEIIVFWSPRYMWNSFFTLTYTKKSNVPFFYNAQNTECSIQHN